MNNDSNNNNVTSQPNNTTGGYPTPGLNNSVNNGSVQPNNMTIPNPTPEISNPVNTVMMQPNSTVEGYPSQELNNSTNNVNSIPTANSVIDANQSSITQQNQQIQTNQNIPSQQSNTTNSPVDDQLLRAFIGNNYDKISTKPFNIPGFFFTSLYMFYRKMFGYAILTFLINLIVINILKTFSATLAFGVVVGLFVNKIYLSYAKKKIEKIKLSNPQKSTEELMIICANKGGTSVGNIFLGLFVQIIISIVVLVMMVIIGIGSFVGELINGNKLNITVNDESGMNNNSSSSKDGTLVEDVSVGGYSCINSICNISIEDSKNNKTDYLLNVSNSELIMSLGDYKDYIKLNIYYTESGNEKTIVDYKIFLKSNNEDISNVKDENELRDKIGLYSIGTHTCSFTLSKIGTPGFGMNGDVSYTYITYTFVDSNNIEYKMKYINPDGTVNLVEGNKYTVTFEVTEGTFEYDFTIKSVK